MKEWLDTWPKWLYEDGQFTPVAKILLSVACVLIAYFLIRLITRLLKRAFGIHKNGLSIDKSASNFFVQTIKILLWIGVAFFIVGGILQINIASFAGILSAITVALGLALQDIITSFASGLIILNQKHILTGEYISVKSDVGECEGEVLKINLMSTTVKTFDGQIITMSNATLRKSIVTNFTRNKIRRIYIDYPVSYDSDPELVKKVLLDITKKDKRILSDPKPDIHYDGLGDYQIKVAFKAWTKYDDYWDVYNSLHEKVILAFKKNKISIPKTTDRSVKSH